MQGEEVNFTISVNNPHNWPVQHPLQINYRVERNDQELDGVTIMVTPASSPLSLLIPERCTTHMFRTKTGPGNNRTQVPFGNHMFVVSFAGLIDYGNRGNCNFDIRKNP